MSKIVELGVGVRFKGNDEFYPNAQTATILMSGDFAEKRPESPSAS